MLLVDIGNTYSKFKFDDEAVIKINTKEIDSKEFLLEYFKNKNLNLDKCLISSVVLNKEIIVKDFVKDKYNIDSIIIKNTFKSRIKYPKINETGTDLYSINEAASINSKTFIAISLGTASVIMFIKDYEFMGCAIAPGVKSSLVGLIDSTSLLNLVSLDKDYSLLSLNTEGALRSGTFNTFKFMVKGFIDEIKNKYNLDKIDTYVTGGFSKIITEGLDNLIIDDELIFKGMKELYKENL